MKTISFSFWSKTQNVSLSQTVSMRFKTNAKGLTLVELMVSLAIGLIIALAAASAYLGARGSAVATENISKINETAKLTLDFIGREIQTSGFFPAEQPKTIFGPGGDATYIATVAGEYTNIKAGAPVSYNQGLFGCDGAQFKTTAGAGKDTCPSAVANEPDSIVLNYFTSDLFGTGAASNIGHMRDCNGSSILNDADNHIGRDVSQPARNTQVPPLPLFISNRIGLNPTNYTTGNNQILSTKSLACSGNGNTSGYQPIFEGIEDLVFRYGVTAGNGTESPQRYYTATEVSALPEVNQKTGWQRVSAVQICIVVRSLDNARLNEQGNATLYYENCRGGTTNYSAVQRTIFKRFERTVAVRNNLRGSK